MGQGQEMGFTAQQQNFLVEIFGVRRLAAAFAISVWQDLGSEGDRAGHLWSGFRDAAG